MHEPLPGNPALSSCPEAPEFLGAKGHTQAAAETLQAGGHLSLELSLTPAVAALRCWPGLPTSAGRWHPGALPALTPGRAHLSPVCWASQSPAVCP